MHAHFFGFDAIGQVGLQWPHRAAPAHARTHAHTRLQVAHLVGHRASVDEQGAFPVGHGALVDDGALPLDAACRQIAAPIEHVVAHARANAAVAIATHRGVATGQKELGDGDLCAFTRQHSACLSPQCHARVAAGAGRVNHLARRDERLPTHQRAGEQVAFWPQRGAQAQLYRNAVAACGGRVAVEVAACPAVVHADGAAGVGGAHPLAVGVVVLQKIVAVDVLGALAAATAHAPAVDIVVARGLALQLPAGEPAPTVVVGQIGPLGAGELAFAVEREFAHRAPAQQRHLVVNVLHRQTRAAVGRDAGAEHQFLQRRFTHLCHHGRCLRCAAVGVEREEHRVVIAAAGQAQLGVEHVGLVVHRASGQAGQAPRAVGVVTLAALHLQRAKPVGRAGVVGHAELGLVFVGVDFCAAVGDLGRGVATRLQLAQAAGLGAVPGRLGERLAGRQRPVFLHALMLAGRGFGVVTRRCCERDVCLGDVCLRPGVHGHRDSARRDFALGRVGQPNGDGGGEISHCAQQLTRVGIGSTEQALQFTGLQVRQVAKALQFEMAFERVANVFGGVYHHHKRGVL